ncbi:hypothetical protein ACFW2D_03365 [Streptomyces sp. NPDC058914]|uniref:hypothetical protein n=1 Tax=Streptomyces sp. NPDC058914 TaxID=3346671 RepID=UPI0036888EC4
MCTDAKAGPPAPVEKRLAGQAGRAGTAVHHMVAAAYGHVLASDEKPSGALMNVIEASSPILQQVRYATELLLPHDRTCPQEG